MGALTFSEQNTLAQNAAFQGFILMGGIHFANDWLASEKVFDLDDGSGNAINADAEGYRSKMHNFCVSVLNLQANRRGALLNSIQSLLIALVSDNMTVTMADFAGDMDAWIDANNTQLTTNILLTFERLAGVSNKEKTAYDIL